MLGQVLHLNLMEVAKTTVQGDERLVDAIDFHTLHQLSREVKTRSWSCHSTLLLCEDALEVLHILLGSEGYDHGS